MDRLTNRDIRRAFGQEAMQVIAVLESKVMRLESVVAAILIREHARVAPVPEPTPHERTGDQTV